MKKSKELKKKLDIYTLITCPIPLQRTLYQLQHVDISVESQPVFTIHPLPLSDWYHFCKAVQTSGLTVLLPPGTGKSVSMVLLSEGIEVGVGKNDDEPVGRICDEPVGVILVGGEVVIESSDVRSSPPSSSPPSSS